MFHLGALFCFLVFSLSLTLLPPTASAWVVRAAPAASEPYACSPVENLSFQNQQTPAVFDALEVAGQALGRVLVTDMTGQCIFKSSREAHEKLFKPDPEYIKKYLLETFLGNHFDAIEVMAVKPASSRSSDFGVTFTAKTSTSRAESWWFDLSEVIEVNLTADRLVVEISSKNYGGRHDIVGHGLGSGSVKELTSVFAVTDLNGKTRVAINSLSLTAISNSAGRLAYKLRRADIEPRTKAKFENKLRELTTRVVGEVGGHRDATVPPSVSVSPNLDLN